jgi:drug/metabolite transporter (DMT)-like permease
MFSLGWLQLAILAAVLHVPGIVCIPLLQKSYGIRPEVTLLWYYIGVYVSVSLLLFGTDHVRFREFLSSWSVLGICALGLIVGGLGTVLLFRSIALSPNVALPNAIVHSSAGIAYVALCALSFFLPKWFGIIRFDTISLIAVVLIIAGIIILAMRNNVA